MIFKISFSQKTEQVIAATLASILARLTSIENKENSFMSVLDDRIAALQAEVTKQTTIDASALALIQGFSAQLAAAVAAAQAAGATAAQLQALTDLQTTIAANDAALAAGVAANTVPTPPTPPAA